MPLKVRRLQVDNARAYQALSQETDQCLVQQRFEWTRAVQALGQDEPTLLVVSNEQDQPIGGLPLYLFRSPYGNIVQSTPQAGGYGGVFWSTHFEHLKAEIHQALIDDAVSFAKEKEAVLFTICTSPFFGDAGMAVEIMKPDYVRANTYQYIDLMEDHLSQINSKQRNNLKRSLRIAAEAGVEVKLEMNDKSFESWLNIHTKRMTDISATPLSHTFLRAIHREVVKSGLGFWTVAYKDERLIGGILFVGHGQVLDVFMMSSDSESIRLQPNALMIEKALEVAKSKGYKYFNWQSSSSTDSGVFSFKKQWGSKTSEHFYLTRVLGDLSRFSSLSLSELREHYTGHYLMPFQELERFCKKGS